MATQKHIRPITAYKKANPKLYEVYNNNLDGKKLSKKQQENNFYWMYACINLDFFTRSEEGKINPFCWKDENTKNNVSTITEMGRLLLAGWYYDIEEFTLDLCKKIHTAWEYKIENNQQFNDMEFAKAIKHIRTHIGYYYHNEDELKVYLLKHFFEKEVQELLPPPPEEYKSLLNAIDFLVDLRNRNLQKDPNFYYRRTSELEDYNEYLEGLLAFYGIEHLPEEDFLEQRNKNSEECFRLIEQQEAEYNEKCKAVLLQSKLLP